MGCFHCCLPCFLLAFRGVSYFIKAFHLLQNRSRLLWASALWLAAWAGWGACDERSAAHLPAAVCCLLDSWCELSALFPALKGLGVSELGDGREQEHFLRSVMAQQGREAGWAMNYVSPLYLLKECFFTLGSSKDYSVCWFLIANKLAVLVVMLMLLLPLMAFISEK